MQKEINNMLVKDLESSIKNDQYLSDLDELHFQITSRHIYEINVETFKEDTDKLYEGIEKMLKIINTNNKFIHLRDNDTFEDDDNLKKDENELRELINCEELWDEFHTIN